MKAVVEIRGPVLNREEVLSPSRLKKMRKHALIHLASELNLPVWRGGYANPDLTKADLVDMIWERAQHRSGGA